MSDAPCWLYYVQAGSYLFGAGAAVVATAKYRLDRNLAAANSTKEIEQKNADTIARQKANEIAERDLDWRKMKAAQSILEQLEDDELATAAMTMLDWQARRYDVDGEKLVVTEKRMYVALRVDGADDGDDFDAVEVHIRDAFDHLLWYFERIQYQIDIGMIDLLHVQFPLGYLAGLMGRNIAVFDRYFEAYGYQRAKQLVGSLVASISHPVDRAVLKERSAAQ